MSGDLTGGTPRNEAGNPNGGTVGVDGPGTDVDADAPEMWFNLQGVRVDGTNPAPGIYIVRKGTKARKVLVTE